MAKVRVQARGADDADDAAVDAAEKGKASSSSPVPKRAPKYAGAIDVLQKVLKEKGISGWYQVRFGLHFSSLLLD